MSPSTSSSLPSIAEADWLQWPATRMVFDALVKDGDDVLAVGGAVRDALLGRQVQDVDLATTAPPETVQERAEAAGLKVVPTGIDHGTVTVIADGRPFEVTTLRKDVETYGRHARVSFTDNWHEDASRRDFTINALYADAGGNLFDPLGVIDDVMARRLRFIGDARARVREDYLRILRFFRFSAELGSSEFDEASLLACVQEREGLARLSSERVQSELLRLLRAPGATSALGMMFDHGLLVGVIGSVPHLARLANLVAIEAELKLKPDAILRLSALALWTSEDAGRLFDRLRLSNADKSKLEAASEFGSIVADIYDGDILWGLYRRGREDYMSAALLAWAASGAPPGDPLWRGMIARIAEHEIPDFPVTGADIMEMGVAEGPEVGELLNALEVHWMASGFNVAKDDLLEVARGLSSGAS